jgi:dipeptidyl aminopeptidase/acylaminoacyl peptidase
MPRFIITLVLIFAIPLFAQNGAKRPFAIADLYEIKSIGDPQISPDGSKILFDVTSYILEEGKSNTDIYLMDANGSNMRKLTSDPAADNHARWSADGKSILFVSTRENGSQAWLLPMTGGEARKLTDISTGVSNPDWVDGQRFGFSSDVFPDCVDDACNEGVATKMAEGPVQAYLADGLLFRQWNFWKEGKRTHTFLFDIEKDTHTDLTPGDHDSPPFSLGGSQGYVFSPDGNELCFVSNRDPNEWETTNKDLFLVPSSGGEAVNITDDNEAYDADPAYSPDGRYIAYIMQTIPTFEADRFRLALYDRQTKQKTVLTESFDNWVNGFQWAPDSRSIYFTADVQGHVPLYNVDLKSQKIRQVIDAKTIDGFDISPDNKWVAFVRRSVGDPREVWRCTADGKNLQRLTTLNKQVEDEVDIRPAEEMWIASPTGEKIHTFVVKPHNFDPAKKYPLILNVHGGPQSQWSDGFRGDWQVYPGAGYIVAFPNPHGSTGYGQEFTAAISKDWAGKVYDDVMAVTDSLAKLPYVDAERMGAMGWSYGGYMMMWMQGHTERFKALVSMMGVYDLTSMWGSTEELWFPQWDLDGAPWESDLYEKLSPHKSAANFKTPCLVIVGEQDYRVPYTQSLEFFTTLQKMKVPSRLIIFKNDGHWPSHVKSMPLYYNAHLDWFHKYLGGDPAPYDVEKMVRNQVFE